MNVKEEIQKTINLLKQMRKFKSQAEIAAHLNYNPSYFSRAINSGEIPMELEDVFFKAFPKSVYLYAKQPQPDNKTDALNQLQKVQNGKNKNAGEGKVLNDGDIIKIKTFVIPMKGFAGLKNAIYDDQYIMDNFAETTTEVPHHLYSPVSYRIQSSGNSMPISIPNNAWVTAVPVPEMMWMTYKFIEDKIYVLFHPYRGILFKYVRNLPFNEIELYSQNRDKNEYPDEKFKITDFRKILLAIKVESFI